jgi:hypothetical protein
MFIHLPIVENRMAQFAAQFEQDGNGWIYYGDRLLGGVSVSEAERTALIAEHTRRLRRTERVLRWWMPIAVVLCVVMQLALHGFYEAPDPWFCAPILLLPMPWVALEWRRADRLAIDLAGRRVAVAPPRGVWHAARLRLAALPLSIGATLSLASIVLVVQTRPWGTSEQHLLLAEGLAGLAFGAWLLWLKQPR